MAHLKILAVPGMPEVHSGDDVAALLSAAIADSGDELCDGDVVVVSSKVVSKAEGRVVTAIDRDAAVDAETVRIVAERVSGRGVTRIVESRSGPVLAAAGVDASNVPAGTFLLLPVDPDASARALRRRLAALTGARIGVVVSDTAGRPWRDGQVDFALGAAGVFVTDDLRGAVDGFGNTLEVTVRALADEVASAADLVKGKLGGVPVAVVRGLGDLVTTEDGPGARALLRARSADWFELGHVEAVRSALGVPPGTGGAQPVPVLPDAVEPRLRRALDVALAGEPPVGALPEVDIERVEISRECASVTVTAVDSPAGATPGSLLALGALLQRLVAAAWAEGLVTQCNRVAGSTIRVTITAELRT